MPSIQPPFVQYSREVSFHMFLVTLVLVSNGHRVPFEIEGISLVGLKKGWRHLSPSPLEPAPQRRRKPHQMRHLQLDTGSFPRHTLLWRRAESPRLLPNILPLLLQPILRAPGFQRGHPAQQAHRFYRRTRCAHAQKLRGISAADSDEDLQFRLSWRSELDLSLWTCVWPFWWL